MKFCEKCDNMYYIGIDEKNTNDIVNYCRYCGNVDNNISTEGSCIINTKNEIENDTSDVINEFTKQDPTLPHLYNVTCPNVECESHKQNKNDVIFIRYNTKDMKFIYLCTFCDYSWNTNDNNK